MVIKLESFSFTPKYEYFTQSQTYSLEGNSVCCKYAASRIPMNRLQEHEIFLGLTVINLLALYIHLL